jgi:transcriptional antiterminator NusG
MNTVNASVAFVGATSGLREPVSRAWYALHVRSRHEFVVSNELKRKGVETFLPSLTKLSQWKDRRKKVEFPLFPGYLFVSIQPTPDAFINVIKTRGAAAFIALEPGHPTPVSADELDALRIILEHEEELDVYPHLKQGARVRVKSGPFCGAEGFLAKKDGQDLLLVNIEVLGRCVGVKIFAEHLEAA